MKTAKLLYKLYLKHAKLNAQTQFSSVLADSLLKHNSSSFWKTWNSKFCTKSVCSSCVDACSGNADIAQRFKTVFADIYSPNNPIVHDDANKDLLAMLSACDNSVYNVNISVDDVESAILLLRKGKAPGFDEITLEHIMYAHPVLIICIKNLFTIMFHCSYVPDAFGHGILIPLLKGSDCDPTNSGNYRGLTLSPIFSKIFEHVLLLKFSNYFEASDLQFGFKKNIGCSDALLCLRSVVSYFNKNGNTVNIACLDVSKAFDKVCSSILFIKLIKRGCPKFLVAILYNWYNKCSVSVRWNNVYSDIFTVCAGVRQGGIMSPVLFAIYIDNMIIRLKDSKLGCVIDGYYFGCLL